MQDGLSKLVTLTLKYNQISSIGLSVFNSSAGLTSLKYINLYSNRLKTLEPWFYYVGINGKLYRRSAVDLTHNNISAFTNKIGWKAKCGSGMKKMHVELKLNYNNVKHLSDILHGWNTNIITWWCLSPAQNQIKFSTVNFDGNFFECDCVDFGVYKVLHFPMRHNFLNNVYCRSPRSLYLRKITSVSLDQFVCQLTDRCPSGCQCVHRPANATLHVYCSSANLTALPLELPALPKTYTKYKLDFSNNRLLRRLEHRPYLVDTSILDVGSCSVDSLDFEIWNELANISQVFLDGNRLRSLPPAVSLQGANFSVGKNPWECSCDGSWMPNWLTSAKGSLINPNDITCSSPSRLKNRNVMSISGEEFCVDPTSEAVKRTLTISMSSVGAVVAVVILLLSAGVIVYRLRVRLYTSWKFHPFDRDECIGEDLLYDVFLSCCSSDNLPHGNAIRERLEERGYRVCYPPRDFLAGETIYDNIYNAIVRSKRTVCFITTQFLQRFVLVFVCRPTATVL